MPPAVPITRDTFIDLSQAEATALAQETMYDVSADGVEYEEVPMPESFGKFGIPQGYCIDFMMDPAILAAVFAKRGIVNEDQLPDHVLQDLKDTTNGSENLKIIPTPLYDKKRIAVDAALEEAPEESFSSVASLCEYVNQELLELDPPARAVTVRKPRRSLVCLGKARIVTREKKVTGMRVLMRARKRKLIREKKRMTRKRSK